MRCQNCGKNECTFHYSYSVNGKTSEVHLCGECADKLGYSDNVFFDTDSFFGADRFFDDIASGIFGRRRMNPFSGFGLMPAMSLMPRLAFRPAGGREEQCSCGAEPREEKRQSGVDPEIAKRREINMLREQMKLAAEKEDYEKAAELRDKIKNMEKEQ